MRYEILTSGGMQVRRPPHLSPLTPYLLALFALMVATPARAQDSVIVIDPDAPATPAAQRTGPEASVIQRVLGIYNDSGTTRLEGSVTIPAESEWRGALGVWRGPLRIGGSVTGPIVVINGDLEILPGGRVKGSVLIIGGRFLGDSSGRQGTLQVYPEVLPVSRGLDGTLAVQDHRRPLFEFGGAQRSFQIGKVNTTLFVSTGGTYDRVEGLPVTLGPRFRYQMAPERRAALELLGVIRTAGDPTQLGEEVGYDAHFDYGVGRSQHHGWGFGARASQLVDAIEPQPLTRSETGWSTLLLHRDYRDYFLNEGVALYGYVWTGSSFRLEGGWRTESQRSLPANDPWTLFRTADPWRPNPLIDDGRYRTTHLGFTFDTRNDVRSATSGNWVRATWEHSTSANVAPVGLPATVRGSIPTDGSYGFDHLTFDARSYNRLNPAMRINFRVVGGGWLGGDPLPVQQRLSLGGPGILPGYQFRQQRCDEGAPFDAAEPALCDRSLAIQAELRSHLDLGLLYRYRDRSHVEQAFGLDQVDFVVHADMGKAWLTGEGPGRVPNDRIPNLDEWMYDLGVGLDAGGIGAYLSKALTDGQPVRFYVRIQRRF